jgi:uncharacterized protein YndB with AHSA1/START domain
MSGRWERTFDISVPVERVWRAFTDPDELRLLLGPPEGVEVDVPVDVPPEERMKVLEAEPMKRLRWSQEHPLLPEKSEFTVTFESRGNGSRITVTRHGFGEGETADIFSTSNALGWEHGMMDLVLYLETGQLVKRHYNGCTLSCSAMSYVETEAGLEVREVVPGGFAEQAGLQRGDRLVRLGQAAVYERADLWALFGVHPAGTELDVEFVRGRERMHGRGRLSELKLRAVGE